MRKVFVVAIREYLAAVRTKTFLLGLLLMPLMMGGSAVLQYLVRDAVDLREKVYAVVDRTPGQKLAAVITKRVEKYNGEETHDLQRHQIKPRLKVELVQFSASAAEEWDQQRAALSDRVRSGELAGFLEIIGGEPYQFGRPPKGGPKARDAEDEGPPHLILRYQTNRPTDAAFSDLAEGAVTKDVRDVLGTSKKLKPHERDVLVKPVQLQLRGLSVRDEATGKVREAAEQNRWTAIAAPMVLMMLMFTVVLMGTMPLMQGVVEEKMQRIAEVLLGSVRPFELMMGKLLGMTAVSMTITAVYLGGAYWVGLQFGVVEQVGTTLLAWFLFYEALAALMFGSLFIAVGAACTDMKETQNLLWPVMLLVVLPVFLLGSVLREPNSPIVVGLSFFPFATPMMMVTRMAVPPGIPWWQPVLGAVPVLLTTVLCVWAAGRIFRVGILMQGKGARVGEMFRWVFRG